MLSGDTSAGKSFVSMALAMAVLDGGQTWLGRDVAGPGRVLICENEMPTFEVDGRLRGFGVRNEHWKRLTYFDKSQAVELDNPKQAARLGEVIEAFRPDLVILDTLFSLAPCLEHNSNGVASAFYRDVLRPLARSTSLLLLHHENKLGGNHSRNPEYAATGARAWAHQADRHLALAAVGDKEVKQQVLANGHTHGSYALELDPGKTRGTVKPRLDLSIETEADAEGHVISTEILVVGDRQRTSDVERFAELILEHLEQCQGDRRKDIAEALGTESNNGTFGRGLKLLEKRKRVENDAGTYQIAK
jgi:hypothetical protein